MPTTKFDAVIFDMDGVIVDSEPLHERAFLQVFDEIGFGTTHGIDFPSYFGKSDLVLWKDFIARHRPPQSLDELLARKEETFVKLLRREEPVFTGLPELLENLLPRYPIALASGSRHPTIQAVLEIRELRRFFSVIVSSEDVPHGKPAPDIFLRTAALLGVPSSACCVIEDSAAGITAARAAGMTAIGITNSLTAGELAHATQVVSTYAEIRELLS